MSKPLLLIIDDDALMVDLVSSVGEGAGFDICQTTDAEAFQKAWLTKPPAAIIMDIVMPRMDGISLIKQLRSLPSYKFTPLLMLTTESGTDKKQEGKAAGATGWIVKPFNPDQLLATIKRVLG